MRSRMLFYSLLCCAALTSSGCSVYMAAAGDDEPNLSNVHRGASRGEIEMALGQPVSMSTERDGTLIATYEYVIGNEPSTGRAIGHAALDVFTFGAWEIFGTPIEAMNQGEKINVTIRYDEAGNASQVQSSKT